MEDDATQLRRFVRQEVRGRPDKERVKKETEKQEIKLSVFLDHR